MRLTSSVRNTRWKEQILNSRNNQIIGFQVSSFYTLRFVRWWHNVGRRDKESHRANELIEEKVVEKVFQLPWGTPGVQHDDIVLSARVQTSSFWVIEESEDFTDPSAIEFNTLGPD